MDRELEEQIDELIQKSTKDLKTRIVRVVTRSINKALKDHSRELKTVGGGSTTHKTGHKAVAAKATSRRSSKKEERYKSDNDSDGYYSD